MSYVEDVNAVPVLGLGYVRHIRHMGDDLAVVNDLRASFGKHTSALREQDRRLLKRCFRRREFSAWRHSVLTVEVKAPLMVARQLHKYSVASAQREDQFGWNEASRRYVSLIPEFHIPQADMWRSAPPEDVKQGSGVPVAADPDGMYFTDELRRICDEGRDFYEAAMRAGICAEQARLFLPAYALYTTWRWTMSLNAFCLVMFERVPEESHAQDETRDYALALREIVEWTWPETVACVEEVTGPITRAPKVLAPA